MLLHLANCRPFPARQGLAGAPSALRLAQFLPSLDGRSRIFPVPWLLTKWFLKSVGPAIFFLDPKVGHIGPTQRLGEESQAKLWKAAQWVPRRSFLQDMRRDSSTDAENWPILQASICQRYSFLLGDSWFVCQPLKRLLHPNTALGLRGCKANRPWPQSRRSSKAAPAACPFAATSHAPGGLSEFLYQVEGSNHVPVEGVFVCKMIIVKCKTSQYHPRLFDKANHRLAVQPLSFLFCIAAFELRIFRFQVQPAMAQGLMFRFLTLVGNGPSFHRKKPIGTWSKIFASLGLTFGRPMSFSMKKYKLHSLEPLGSNHFDRKANLAFELQQIVGGLVSVTRWCPKKPVAIPCGDLASCRWDEAQMEVYKDESFKVWETIKIYKHVIPVTMDYP